MGIRPASCEVAVIGAGLAGLSAARALRAAGRDVVVIESSDDVGGRVRTDEVDGFLLDRGFQVLLTAYPEMKRQFDMDALDLRAFEPGAMVWLSGKGRIMSDPFRRPATIAATTLAPVGSLTDKIRLAGLRSRVGRGDARRLLRSDDVRTLDMLRATGFSSRMIQRFFIPLAGGIQLDPELTASRRMFDLVFRMLSEGDAAVPANGMRAIPRQLASHIERDRIHLNTRVSGLSRQPDSHLVTVDDGSSIATKAVIVATEGPAASMLLGLEPVASRSVSCVYFDAPSAPTDSRYIVLDGTGAGPVLNVAVMSNISPLYAPAGRHLIAAAMPGVTGVDAEPLARTQLARMFGASVSQWRHLRTYDIPHGQPDMSPPLNPKKPVSLGEGLFVCGDHRDTASIQGALFSGRRCAEAVLELI